MHVRVMTGKITPGKKSEISLDGSPRFRLRGGESESARKKFLKKQTLGALFSCAKKRFHYIYIYIHNIIYIYIYIYIYILCVIINIYVNIK
jgi:hypothetical protein